MDCISLAVLQASSILYRLIKKNGIFWIPPRTKDCTPHVHSESRGGPGEGHPVQVATGEFPTWTGVTG